MARKLFPVCDTLGPCRLSCTCVDSKLDPFRPLLLKCVNVEKTHVESTDVTLLVQHLLVSSSQDCEHPLHSWICAFLSNHLSWCSSCSSSHSSSVRAFHNSNIHSNPCSCPCPCSCPVLVVLAVLASLCLCPCRACPPPGCDEPFSFAFRAAWPLHSQYVLTSSLKTPFEFSLARFNCTCFSRSSGNKAFS